MIGTGCAPQAPADLEAVEAGHHHVEDDEVEGGSPNRASASRPSWAWTTS